MHTDTHRFPFHRFKNSSPERRKTLITNNRVATALLATAATSFALLPVAQAAEIATARACVDAENVWVQVDFGTESDQPTKGGCATDFTDGLVALESAGFDVDYIDSEYGAMLTGIEGVAPIWTEDNPVYWSYWSGNVAADYTVAYESYMVGASGSTPEAGTVEAWVASDGSLQPSLTELVAAPAEDNPSQSSGSSADTGIFAVIAGILALVGGGLAALFTIPGLNIPGVVLPKL